MKVFAEINAIKISNTNLTLKVENNRKEIEERVRKVEERLTYRKENDVDLTVEIRNAPQKIEAQSNKIMLLEKSLHSNLQHDRKWNVEIDGIPTEVGEDHGKLEEVVIQILAAISVPCKPEDILFMSPTTNNFIQ